jgi:hypothetical protein
MNKERIQYLINNLQEGLEIEAKNWLGGLKTNEAKAKLAKEIIALANHGGGYIFIGFDDENQLAEIPPLEDESGAFNQDSIAGIVNRYAEPAFQCEIGYFRRTGSEISHPVIVVPGNHRTPIFAKAGGPDPQILESGRVYVRRPGGNSEQARSQDDWEKLLDRLVKSRQEELIRAFRDALNPSSEKQAQDQSLREWHNQCYSAWKELVATLPEASPHRLTKGHWAFSFEILDFPPQSLNSLNQYLDREAPRLTGWPVFTYLHGENRRPNAAGETIQAWLADLPHEDATDSDFWRVHRSGKGFLLRPMQEDWAQLGKNSYPPPKGPLFDWSLPVWRVAECLKFLESLALRFADKNASFGAMIQYHGTQGRHLFNRDWSWNLAEENSCMADCLESTLTGSVSSIRLNLPELVQQFLAPIFEQFQFAELPQGFVNDQISKLLNRR